MYNDKVASDGSFLYIHWIFSTSGLLLEMAQANFCAWKLMGCFCVSLLWFCPVKDITSSYKP